MHIVQVRTYSERVEEEEKLSLSTKTDGTINTDTKKVKRCRL